MTTLETAPLIAMVFCVAIIPSEMILVLLILFICYNCLRLLTYSKTSRHTKEWLNVVRSMRLVRDSAWRCCR